MNHGAITVTIAVAQPKFAEAPKCSRPRPHCARHAIEQTVADVFGIDCESLRQPTRGQAKVALARQVCMYIAHVCGRLSLTEVGDMFGRDRTTVSHACALVEQRRDNGDFDNAIDLIELIVFVLSSPRTLRWQEEPN